MENVIIVSEEDRDMVQRADVEMSSRRDIIVFMINNNMNITSERFQEYQNEYNQKFLDFEAAKNYIQNKYLNGLSVSNWVLNYFNCELSYVAN